ncbi:MAG: hypothetical protein MUE71_04575 [Chitinophagaceae bacterium]|nr:hypothetical protein [Chitinophagaceae bacterium]
MNKLYTFLIALLFSLASFGQLNQVTFGYQLSLPQATMKNGWNSGHGIHFGYHRYFKAIEGFSLGADIGIGNYALERQPQQYVFEDGTITNTEASLSSSLAYGALAARYEPLWRNKLSPFIEIQGGYFGMYSSLFIEDPRDPLGCRALESKDVVSSGTAFWSPGLGFDLELGKDKNDIHGLALSARYVMGGQLEYANMNRLYHTHNGQTNGQPENTVAGESPLMVTFINVTTNQLHEHSVAELYNHPLRVLQFNLTYTYRFGKH